MPKDLKIRFRKEQQGPEADLVKNFLNCNKLFSQDRNLEYSIFTELYAEVGIPDIVIIAWDKQIKKKWSPERSKLQLNDIKILHHISLAGKRGIKFWRLQKELGFDKAHIEKSIQMLIDANLAKQLNETVRLTEFDDIFYIKKIIAIEAKMKNWKCAFEQARLNENFSSHSYVLLPNEKINENIISSIGGKTGLLGHYNTGTKLKKKAKKSKLPGSYFSWVLNEYIGRQYAAAT